MEFLLSIMALLFLVFWAFEMSMMVYTYTVIGAAAKIGVRYAIVHGTDNSNCSGPSTGCSDSTATNVTTAVTNYAKYSLHDVSGITVNAYYPDSSSAPPSRVIVHVSYTYVPYINLPWTSPTLVASAAGRIVY